MLAAPETAARRRAGDDTGFTLIEVLVSFIVLGIVMTATINFFVSATRAGSKLRQDQVAVQLADDALEQTNALPGSNLLQGRDQTTTLASWQAVYSAVPSVDALLDSSNQVWDATAAAPAADGTGACSNTTATVTTVATGTTLCIPVAPVTQTVNKIQYSITTLIAQCYEPEQVQNSALPASAPANTSAIACIRGGLDPTKVYLPMYRVVAVVQWTTTSCPTLTDPAHGCNYVSSTLQSATKGDPVFNPAAVGFNDTDPLATHPGTLALDAMGDLSTTVGVTAYALTTYSGGAGSVKFSATGLPTGEAIDAVTGLISGAPASPGRYTAQVTATDSSNATSTVSFTWTVNGSLTITDPPTQVADKAGPYTYAMQYTGGTGALTWSASGLPSGLSIDSASGVISGTVTANSGSYSAVITAKDVSHATDTANVAFTVNAAVTAAAPAAWVIDYAAGTVSVPFTAAGGAGTGNYSWTISGQPTGLSVNASTGVVSGSPTSSAPTKVTLTATDTLGGTASVSVMWYPVFPTALTTDSNANVTVLIAGPAANTLSKTTSPSSSAFTVSTTTGVLSANRPAAGVYTVGVVSSGTTKPITWTVSGALALANPGALSTPVNQPFSYQLAASGGTTPYTFATTSTLPSWLSLDPSTGILSGTPTATATAKSYTFVVTDTGGGSQSVVPSITVTT